MGIPSMVICESTGGSIDSKMQRCGRVGHWAVFALAIGLAAAGSAAAQDRGTLNPRPLPALAHPDDPKTPARELFARRPTAALATMHSRTIGFYAKGCLAGGMELPINGPTWQVMRLSRNRNWAHPKMVELL